MRFRSVVFCALFAIPCLAQTTSTSPAPALKIFHDASHDLTLGYPEEFTPVAQATEKSGAGQCVRSILTAGSETKLGSSAFVVSVIDATCPGVLKQAEQPSSFTREQILRQLKGYGMATLTQEPYRYSIDGRSAAVTLASARPDDSAAGGSQKKTTYAAKACLVSDIPSKSADKKSAPANGEVICFDYTTQNRELLTRILSFTITFADGQARPVVPGSALR